MYKADKNVENRFRKQDLRELWHIRTSVFPEPKSEKSLIRKQPYKKAQHNTVNTAQ